MSVVGTPSDEGRGRVDETTSLLGGRTQGEAQGVTSEVVPMRYCDLPRATEACLEAFEGDMIIQYRYEADTNPFATTRQKLRDGSGFAGTIYQNRILTIDAGDAFMKYATPENRTLPSAVTAFQAFLRRLQPEEAVKRFREFLEVLEVMTVSAFGSVEKTKEMYEIQGLCVAPQKQGRGYGTQLVRTMLDMSDAEGRDCFVFTGRSYGFYETLGFKVVAKGELGTHNPSWHHEPAELILMHRPAKS